MQKRCDLHNLYTKDGSRLFNTCAVHTFSYAFSTFSRYITRVWTSLHVFKPKAEILN